VFDKDKRILEEKIAIKPVAVYEDTRVLCALVSENVGVGICFKQQLEKCSCDVLEMALDGVDMPKMVVRLLYNKEAITKPAKAFIDMVKNKE
jgi:hypothetical protein